MGSQVEAAPEGARRHRAVALSRAFFVGSLGTIVALGAVATYTGHLLVSSSRVFSLGLAAFALAAGLAAIFGPALRRRLPDGKARRGGTAGAFVQGVLYSLASLTTTAGPLILLLATVAATTSPAYGVAISLAYGVGRAAPFLLLGLFAGRVAGWLAHAGRARRTAEIVSGIVLVGVAGYFAGLAPASRARAGVAQGDLRGAGPECGGLPTALRFPGRPAFSRSKASPCIHRSARCSCRPAGSSWP